MATNGLFKCVTIIDIPITVNVREVKAKINGELLPKGLVSSSVVSHSTFYGGGSTMRMNRYNISVDSVYGQSELYGGEIKTMTKNILDTIANSYPNGAASYLTCTFTPEI